jgi:hypothetical protein
MFATRPKESGTQRCIESLGDAINGLLLSKLQPKHGIEPDAACPRDSRAIGLSWTPAHT